MGSIIIRALAGGALSGTTERHPLAMQSVDSIGSAPSFADVARARELEPLVRESGSSDLTEFAERFVIAHPAVSTMLVGYSTLDHLEAAIAAVNKGSVVRAIIGQSVPEQADSTKLSQENVIWWVCEVDGRAWVGRGARLSSTLFLV